MFRRCCGPRIVRRNRPDDGWFGSPHQCGYEGCPTQRWGVPPWLPAGQPEEFEVGWEAVPVQRQGRLHPEPYALQAGRDPLTRSTAVRSLRRNHVLMVRGMHRSATLGIMLKVRRGEHIVPSVHVREQALALGEEDGWARSTWRVCLLL